MQCWGKKEKKKKKHEASMSTWLIALEKWEMRFVD